LTGFTATLITLLYWIKAARTIPRLLHQWSLIHSPNRSFGKVKSKILIIFVIFFLRNAIANGWFRYGAIAVGRKCWMKQTDRPRHQAIIEFLYGVFFSKYKYNDFLGVFAVVMNVHLVFGLWITQYLVVGISIIIAWEFDTLNDSLVTEKASENFALYKKLSELMDELNRFLSVPLVLMFTSSLYSICMRITFYLR